MDIRVVYIGNDQSYWKKLQSRFSETYTECSFTFLDIPIDDGYIASAVFAEVYQAKVQIIYLDLSLECDVGLRLAKWLNRNNETRLASLVGLYGANEDGTSLQRGLNASIRLNHIKSSEVADVVYDPISLLDVNMAQMPEFVRSNEIENFEILQPLRISYIDNNRFHIETNSYLKLGDIVSIKSHPLEKVMPSTKVYVETFSQDNLYYNMRFAYDLEFIFVDNDYFVSTNENWKKYKSLKEKAILALNEGKDQEKKEISNDELNLEEIFTNDSKFKDSIFKDVSEEDKSIIVTDIKKRQELYKPTQDAIDSWMERFKGRQGPKKLKVMVIDNTLEMLGDLKADFESFPYSLSYQTILLDDFYQIERTRPHLIVFKETEENNLETLKLIVEKINSINLTSEYKPYLLILCSSKSSEELQTELSFEYIIASSLDSDLEFIKSMAEKLNSKIEIPELREKVFFQAADIESNLLLIRMVKVVALTESILYFQCETEVPMWTVFKVEVPVKMLLTVVPHKDSGSFAKTENCYRCLINGVGEAEKAEIRKLINSTLKEVEDVPDES